MTENVNTQMILGQYKNPQGQLVFVPVRLGRAWLTTPYKGKPDRNGKIPDPKFRVELIVPFDHPQLAEIKLKQRAAAEKKFGSEAQQKLLIAETQDKLAIHKGDVTRAGQAEYAGALYLTASNKEQPTIVATDVTGLQMANRGSPNVLLPSHARWPYAGSYVCAHLDFFAYQNEGTGISAGILGVQFVRDGQKLQGAFVSTGSEFGLAPADADGAPPAAPVTGAGGLV